MPTVTGQAALAGSGAITVGASGRISGRVGLGGSGAIGVVVAPVGTRRRVVVVDQAGNLKAELENAQIGEVTFELRPWEDWSFRLPVSDPKASWVLGARFREAQIWRGDQLLSWGPMKTPRVDDANITVEGVGAGWYLSKRVLGKPGGINRLVNPSFDDGVAGWSFEKSAWFLDFQPLGPLDGQIVASSVAGTTKALQINNAYDPSFPGFGVGDVVGYQEFVVAGGTRGLTATLAGWCLVPSSLYVGWGTGQQRGLTLARLASDYRTNNYWTRGANPASNTWGGARGQYTDTIEWNYTAIDVTHPFDVWVRHQVTLTIPPGVTEVLHARFGGVEGATRWTGLTLYYDDAFEANDEDQASIVSRLVAHAQDPTYGKSSVNIAADCPPTGVKRQAAWLFAEHAPIWQLMETFTKLRDGLDIIMTYTSTQRRLTTRYPSNGTYRPNLALEVGRNIAKVDSWTWDGESAATSEIGIGAADKATNSPRFAGGSGAQDRPERVARDTSSFADALILEEVFSAGPDVTPDALQAATDERLTVARNPEVLEVTTYPHDAGITSRNLIGRLFVGDTVPVHIAHGALVTDGVYRVARMVLRPDDSLGLTLNATAGLHRTIAANSVAHAIGGLHQRLQDVERVLGKAVPDVPGLHVMFSMAGALVIAESPAIEHPAGASTRLVIVTLGTAGVNAVVVELRRNGTTFQTVTLPAGITRATVNSHEFFSTLADTLTVAVVASGATVSCGGSSGAAKDLGVQVIFGR